jgi:acetyl-CoA C-acetyltransferase
MEAMSQVPLVARGVRWGTRLGGVMLEEPLMMRNPIVNVPIAVGVGEVALDHGIDRAQQDEWALQSHRRYFAALGAGKFRDEIAPWARTEKDGSITEVVGDESPRPDTSLEKLGRLPPVYGGKTVTAGNAPGLSDGASALILMSRERQEALRLTPLATLLCHVNTAGEPLSSPYMPALSIKKALARTGVGLKELKRIEINEAFAAVPLVSTQVLAGGDKQEAARLAAITNVNGGAVAIGHPTGASGARLVMTLIYELRRLGGGLGAAAICGGFGQSDAVIVRVEG